MTVTDQAHDRTAQCRTNIAGVVTLAPLPLGRRGSRAAGQARVRRPFWTARADLHTGLARRAGRTGGAGWYGAAQEGRRDADDVALGTETTLTLGSAARDSGAQLRGRGTGAPGEARPRLADLTRAAGGAHGAAVALIGRRVDAGPVLTGATRERRTRGPGRFGLARALLTELLAVLLVAIALLALLALAAFRLALARLRRAGILRMGQPGQAERPGEGGGKCPAGARGREGTREGINAASVHRRTPRGDERTSGQIVESLAA